MMIIYSIISGHATKSHMTTVGGRSDTFCKTGLIFFQTNFKLRIMTVPATCARQRLLLVRIGLLLLTLNPVASFAPSAANFTVLWPKTLSLEVVVGHPYHDISELLTLLSLDIRGTLRHPENSLHVQGAIERYADAASLYRRKVRHLKARLSDSINFRQEDFASSTPMPIPAARADLNPPSSRKHTAHTDPNPRSPRSILNFLGLASATEVRLLREHLDNEHQAAMASRDQLKIMKSAVNEQVAQYQLALNASGGVVNNHTLVHKKESVILLLLNHEHFVSNQVDRLEALVVTLETGIVHPRFLANAFTSTGELIYVLAASDTAIHLHLLITTSALRLFPTIPTKDPACCSIHVNEGYTAIPCRAAFHVPYYQNFFPLPQATCTHNLHPASVHPEAGERCDSLDGYARNYRCYSSPTRVALGVDAGRPDLQQHIHSLRPTGFDRQVDTSLHGMVVHPPTIRFLDLGGKEPAPYDLSSSISLHLEDPIIIAFFAISLSAFLMAGIPLALNCWRSVTNILTEHRALARQNRIYQPSLGRANPQQHTPAAPKLIEELELIQRQASTSPGPSTHQLDRACLPSTNAQAAPRLPAVKLRPSSIL